MRYSVSRWTGLKPASRMMRRSSSSVVQFEVPAALDDIFFEHHRAYVVAAEVQAQLEHLQSLRDPTGLHVLNVVEIEPCDGEHL